MRAMFLYHVTTQDFGGLRRTSEDSGGFRKTSEDFWILYDSYEAIKASNVCMHVCSRSLLFGKACIPSLRALQVLHLERDQPSHEASGTEVGAQQA